MLTGAPLDNLPRNAALDPPKPILLVSFVSLQSNLSQQLKKSVFRNKGTAVFQTGRVVAVNRVGTAPIKNQPPAQKNTKSKFKSTNLVERHEWAKKLFADAVRGSAHLKAQMQVGITEMAGFDQDLESTLDLVGLRPHDIGAAGPITAIQSIEKGTNEARVHYKNGEFRKFKLTPAGCKGDQSDLDWYQAYKGRLLPPSSQTRNNQVFFYSNMVHSKCFKEYIVIFLADGKVAATKTTQNTAFTKMNFDWVVPPQLRQYVLEDPFNLALLPSSQVSIHSDLKLLIYMSKASSDGTLPGNAGQLPQLTVYKWDNIKEAVDKSTNLEPVGNLPLPAGWILENFVYLQKTQELYTLYRPEPLPVVDEGVKVKGFKLASAAPLFMLELHLRDLSNVTSSYHTIDTFWKPCNKGVFKVSQDVAGLQKIKPSDVLFGTLTCSSNLDKNGVIMLGFFHVPSASSVLVMIKHLNLPGASVLRSVVLSGGLANVHFEMTLLAGKKQAPSDWKVDQEWSIDDNPFFDRTKVDMDYETAVGSKNIPVTHSLRRRHEEMLSGALTVHKDYLLCCTEGGRVYLLKASARTKTPKLAVVGNKRGVKLTSHGFGTFNLQGMCCTAIDSSFGRPKAKVCIFSSQGFVTTAELG